MQKTKQSSILQSHHQQANHANSQNQVTAQLQPTLIPLSRMLMKKLSHFFLKKKFFFSDDINSGAFFSASDAAWPPQLTFDLSSTAGLHTLIPTLLPAHLQVKSKHFILI